MAVNIKEKKFIEQVLKTVTQIISNQEELTSSVDIFIDREYADNLTEDDFLSYGLQKNQFTEISNFVLNFNLFLDGINVVNKDQRKVLNILRTDK